MTIPNTGVSLAKSKKFCKSKGIIPQIKIISTRVNIQFGILESILFKTEIKIDFYVK